MQYIRDSYEEYIEKVGWLKLRFFKFLVPYLRKRDKKYTHFDEVVFNSKYTSELAKKIYWLNWKIIYPMVDKQFFDSKIEKNPLSYYVYVWRLVRFSKECDKIVELFNEIEEPLLVIWNWPDEKYLKKNSKWNIIFLWRIKNTKERIEIMRKAKWLINITKESFWLVTAESLLLWVPVLGYSKWATPELVDEKSWYLVENKEIKTLKKWFNEFKNIHFDREYIAKKIREKIK